MTPFTVLTSVAAPLLRDNVDTDAIIPSREMKSTGKTGLAAGLFAPWRYLSPGSRDPDPAFVLNQPRYANAHILLGGDNFGCGSSREHAVWALAEYGIRAIIAPSFAPIFAGNCIRNGVLPVVLDRGSVATIAAANEPVTIDLAQQQVEAGSQRWNFAIGAEAKAMLLEGLDGIELTLKHRERIAAFQRADRLARPWIYFSTQP
ncbi:3-isopropylmalate dehydratase small subunit [Steroidobacter agaridevorans]|uniref:3-isopropylmalate dehydratase small subunit n=1 Tax=Steroidobacter agaridevorans TaxID=2695856 RepID=UPI0013295A45|nr:3-isopropylmalate dehydratase small subunit [Steroidobacter agaridevorans]GFE87468.1 3-isopropylmalate dehydratase small subunit [Steroidobacter agaridevorans]